jgi:hypothetical protein
MGLNKGIYVAICGKKNSGKNTLAFTLASKVHRAQIIALADPIKEIGQLMFPWADPDGWWGSSSKRDNVIPNTTDNQENPLTYRQVLIDIGTQARRYNPLHWVNVFDHNFHNLVSQYGEEEGCIVSDVRFHNEFNYLRNKGFYLIKLIRDDAKSSTDATETNQDQIKLEDYDKVIYNNGTLNSLKQQVSDLMPTIIDHQKSR